MIRLIQSKANAATFVPNLLDFGMLFSGLDKESQALLRDGFGRQGNGFTRGGLERPRTRLVEDVRVVDIRTFVVVKGEVSELRVNASTLTQGIDSRNVRA